MASGRRLCSARCWIALCLLSVCSGRFPESEDIGLADVTCSAGASAGCSSISGCPLSSSAARCGPEQDSDVYDALWDNSQDIAMETLKLPFLQHLRLGDLRADEYVTFTIQDINYLQKVTDMLKDMSDKVTKPEDIREFFKNRYESYKKFADATLKQFNLKDVKDINPIPSMKKYLDDYQNIMKEDPIFFAVSLLPCSRLWLWLANQMDMSYGNAYFIWKKNNMHGNPEKHYRQLLKDHLTTPYQIKRANQIFRQQMQNEHDFFAASPLE